MQSSRSSGLVWITSSCGLFLYGFLTLQDYNVPGVEQIVGWVSSLEPQSIYLAAFVAVLIEGLYIVGNFFPGATLIVIVSILSQTGGPLTFLLTMGAIFLGWCLAGIINICTARVLQYLAPRTRPVTQEEMTDSFMITWYPAFGANQEFAQSLNGRPLLDIFLKSTLRKLVVCAIMLGVLSLVPLLIDITEIDNTEGSISIFLFASIGLVIGVRKFRAENTNL